MNKCIRLVDHHENEVYYDISDDDEEFVFEVWRVEFQDDPFQTRHRKGSRAVQREPRIGP